MKTPLIYIIALIALLAIVFLFLTNAKEAKIRKAKSKLSHLNKKLQLLNKWKSILDEKSGKWYFAIKVALFTIILFLVLLLEIGIAYFSGYDIVGVAIITKVFIIAIYRLACGAFLNKVYTFNEVLELADNWFKSFIYRRNNFDPKDIELTQKKIALCEQELQLLKG